MDFNRAAIFVRVVEADGFTVAAKALGQSKSSVSRTVSLLEEELGVRLLQRTTRKLRLTDAGQTLYARARRALSELDEAATEVAALGEKPRGVVRLTAPIDIAIPVLGEFLAEFSTKYPLIHVELELTSRIVDLVGEGFDLALRAGAMDDSTLVARKVGRTGFGLFASADYLGLHGRPTTLKELGAHACVLFRPRNGRALWQFVGPEGDESVEVSGRIGSNDLLFNRRAIELGLGIGAIPLFLAEGDGSSTGLVRVLPEYAFMGGSLYLVMPSARHIPGRVAVLRDFLIERLTVLDWGASERGYNGDASR